MWGFKRSIKIFDTTLRDGEQMPGVVFRPEEKIELAIKSSEFGSFVINLMPSVSEAEFNLTKKLSSMGLEAEICADCMLNRKQVESAIRTGAQRIMPIASVSDIHLVNKLKITREENLRRALEIADLVREHGIILDLCFEDATRADPDYVEEFIRQTSKRVEYFMPADTLGCLTPLRAHDFYGSLKKKFGCLLCFHGHNDFGMATANAVAALEAGVDAVSATFNGIGERSGNVPIEELCIAAKYLYGADTGARLENLVDMCRLVEKYSQVPIHVNKPVTGENSFTHESGIHVDGIIKSSVTYENFDPRNLNLRRKFLFGKHSGMSGIRYVLRDLSPSDSQVMEVLLQLKTLSENKKTSFSEAQVLDLFKNNFMRDGP